ncbi:helix-turn-helix domain-containing protein [Streptomyces sp. NPDC016845]|uniref:helix-turn-helix domain-containing protein n=1 Tax=Streptomyces sp. NPDC016845 TaxID=3364972 RepID=UPI0037B5C34E
MPAAPDVSLNPRGITHVNTPQTSRFTVVGNHLAQHRDLSGLAIGLAVHIQSLPPGARADIKTLAARFPEGETRIAAALRELETHGYLSRIRKRLPSGRVVTHTVSFNAPVAPIDVHTPRAPVQSPEPVEPEPPEEPKDPAEAERPEEPEPPEQPVTPPPAPTPPLPEPSTSDPTHHRTAATLLISLHHQDPRLLLPEHAVQHLTPAVAAWLERDVRPEAVRHALTANLPRERLRNPAGLLAHRLTALLPPPAPTRGPHTHSGTAEVPPPRPPLHSCEGCERAIRSPAPGAYCRDCRADVAGAADIADHAA